MLVRISKYIVLAVLLSCIWAGMGKSFVCADEQVESPSAAKVLEQLKDEKIQIKLKSGKKVKGILREVSGDRLHLQKKNVMVEVEIAEIRDIKLSGGIGASIGGFFYGMAVGTGGFFSFILVSYLIYSLG